ncbi:hypothetical protein FEE95_12655 [Maribacter algarum]|uniref:Uncharacterized protein n=1 Tax=Maribacter algarum (ex Zhang et al. 2020) TaxID=2578118 RepID=A0A5S3PWE5_9FLAO|nr:hypothetical protein [Maribacter algarum]TMM57328.1 hypothetical protein FEE95_12655 [Maribacter algarum]
MKTIGPHRISFTLPYLFVFAFLFYITSCSKDASILTEQEDAVSEDTEEMNDDSSNDDTSNDNSSDTMDIPPTGAVVFNQDFTLDATRSVANYVLPQSDYNLFLEGEGNLKQVSEKAYQYFKDDFDYIIILSVEAVKPPDLFFGRSTLVQNQVQGLGSNTYDNSATYGSEGKLKSIIYMPRTEYIKSGPFLHEIAHSWGNKGIIPTTVGGHWGYASVAGQLGGFDEIEDLGNNTYQGKLNGQNGFGAFANGGNSVIYGDLELYAMGLIGADELEPIQVAVNPEGTQAYGQFTADAIGIYTAQDLINEHGARVPSTADSQKVFKALTIVISTEAISQEKMDEVTSNLDNFSRQAAPDASWGSTKNFWLATKEKATFDFTVTQGNIK